MYVLSEGPVRGRERQRSPRVQTSITAVVVGEDGGELPVEVLDLSSGGFRVHSSWPLTVGAKLRLRVDRYGDFPAEILWVNGLEAGGRFLEPVTL